MRTTLPALSGSPGQTGRVRTWSACLSASARGFAGLSAAVGRARAIRADPEGEVGAVRRSDRPGARAVGIEEPRAGRRSSRQRGRRQPRPGPRRAARPRTLEPFRRARARRRERQKARRAVRRHNRNSRNPSRSARKGRNVGRIFGAFSEWRTILGLSNFDSHCGGIYSLQRRGPTENRSMSRLH
jgi:hypothetical protein